MAGAKPGVHLCQLKLPQVHSDLVMGSKFLKVDEDNSTGISFYFVFLKVDAKGYIAYWKDVQTGQHETDFIDLYLLRDVRNGKSARVPRDNKVNDVCSTFGDSLCPIEDRAVTLCWGNDFVNLQWTSFVAATAETAKLWCQELFTHAYNLLSVNVSVGIFYERAWTKLFLTHQDNKVSLKNVLRLFAVHKDDKDRIIKALKDAGIPVIVANNNEYIQTEQLSLPRFMEFCYSLSMKQEVQQIFDELAERHSESSPDSNAFLSVEKVKTFLNTNQRDPRLNELLFPYWTDQRARALIERFEPDEELRDKGHMSLSGFIQLLISEDNNVAPFNELDLSHEMTHPLSHYYIASSHNTYLTGHQLTGKSSVEMYRQVLLSGCRCVELDCWDGRAPDEEPIIKHGFTMVTEIPLKEALEAINECAFKTSDFPVILSLENHCSPKQQTKIAQHLRTVFGPALMADPLPSHPLEPGIPLPSPSLLMKRILIKNKKLTAQQQSQQPTAASEKSSAFRSRADSNGSMSRSKIENSAPVCESPTTVNQSQISMDDNVSNTMTQSTTAQLVESDPEADSGDEYTATPSIVSTSTVLSGNNLNPNQPTLVNSMSSNSLATVPESQAGMLQVSGSKFAISKDSNSFRRPSKQHAIYTAVKDLSDLVNYIQPVHFISFESAALRDHSFETSSISETTCFNLLKLYPVEFVNYNKRQLSRVYPRGTRVDSHNYLPFLFWVAGCQMVALNYQILDLGMQLYLGCFEFNGRCGFLLKPACMVQKSANFSPFLESATDHSVVAATVSVRIISGQYLSPRRLSTFCEVEMFGLPSDSVRKKFRTKLVQNNGLNPVFNSETFVFNKVVLPRLAILRFVVYDDTNRFVGHRILPVEYIKPGYRFICLRSESNQPIPSASLLVYIKVHDFLADKHRELADALANPIAYLTKLEARAKQLEVLEDGESTEQPQLIPGIMSGGPSAVSSPTGAVPPPFGSIQSITSNAKASLLVTQSNPVINSVSPISSSSQSSLVPHNVRPSLPAGDILSPPISEKAAGGHRQCRLSAAGLERIQRQRPDDLPPVAEIYNSQQCIKLFKKRDQILNMLRKKYAKSEISDDADQSRKEKFVANWRKCYAEQRGVAVKYTELLAASANQVLTGIFNEKVKSLSQLFRTEERELRRLLSRERSAKLKEVSSSAQTTDSQANSDSTKDEVNRRKRQLQQELIDRAVDEITNMKEASQAMEQRLRRSYEDRQRELEDWRRERENELEQQYAAVLASLENAAATGTLTSLHATERLNQLRDGQGALVIGGVPFETKHLSKLPEGTENSSPMRNKTYSGLLALLPPIDEPGSNVVVPDESFCDRASFNSPKASAISDNTSPQREHMEPLLSETENFSKARQSSNSVRKSFRRLLSCFR